MSRLTAGKILAKTAWLSTHWGTAEECYDIKILSFVNLTHSRITLGESQWVRVYRDWPIAKIEWGWVYNHNGLYSSLGEGLELYRLEISN